MNKKITRCSKCKVVYGYHNSSVCRKADSAMHDWRTTFSEEEDGTVTLICPVCKDSWATETSDEFNKWLEKNIALCEKCRLHEGESSFVKRTIVCPCRISKNRCMENCTCFNSASSAGCLACASYGSGEQRANSAERIVKAVTQQALDAVLPVHLDCHDIVCNGSRRHPRRSRRYSCSCGRYEERLSKQLTLAKEALSRIGQECRYEFSTCTIDVEDKAEWCIGCFTSYVLTEIEGKQWGI